MLKAKGMPVATLEGCPVNVTVVVIVLRMLIAAASSGLGRDFFQSREPRASACGRMGSGLRYHIQ